MDYEEFLRNYSPELQLIDALDALTHFCPDAAETIDRLVSQTNNEKSVSEPLQTDQTPQTSAPDTQLP